MEQNPVYEDEDLMIFDKPQGIASTPGKKPDFCSAVFARYPFLKEVQGYHKHEGGLLNRLDEETGGLLFFAKIQSGFDSYSRLMKKEAIEKHYCAWVWGRVAEKSGEIRVPMAHHPKNAAKMTAVPHAKIPCRGKPRPVVSYFEKIKEDLQKNATLLKITIRRGARHQIRVHLAFMGHSIVGDRLYGSDAKDPAFPFHLLYASGASWITPRGEKKELWISPPFEKGF